MTKKKCVICGIRLGNPDIFPKDFPKKYRLCCICLITAETSIMYGDDCDLPNVEELVKLITLTPKIDS